MRRLIPLCAVALAGLPLAAYATPFTETVRAAVADRKLRDSNLKGSASAPTPFRQVAAGGAVLVGLEVGLGGAAPSECVVAVRPLYRDGERVRAGTPAGQFLSDEVRRTVRLEARAGYAVGGLHVAAGRRLNGLAVRFLRRTDDGLDPSDAYDSDWVGASAGEECDLLDGPGRPVVGLFGRVDGDAVVGLGLTFADVPLPTPPAAESAAEPATNSLSAPVPEVRPASSGQFLLVILVFAAVAVPIGIVGVATARRRPRRVQQLPRLSVIEQPRPSDSSMPRPPSLPGTLVTTPVGRPFQELVDREADSFRH